MLLFSCFHVAVAEPYGVLKLQLNSTVDRSTVHRLKSQAAQAAMRAIERNGLSSKEQNRLSSEIKTWCADVQLGSMDLWYGESVVTWARLLLHESQREEARIMLLDQAEILQNIEKNLTANGLPVSSISPVAGCRHVLGEAYLQDFADNGSSEDLINALKHFCNVYIKYGDGPWGEKAQSRAEEIEEILLEQGRNVRIQLGPHKETYIAGKFRLGKKYIREERYEDAQEPILEALNFFPETEQAVPALHDLARCEFEVGQDESILMIAEYCAERFHTDTNAPSVILNLGYMVAKEGEDESCEKIFALYLESFPDHEKRVDILAWFAWSAFKAEDYQEACQKFSLLESELRRIGEAGERLEKAVYIQAMYPAHLDKLNAFIKEFPESERLPSVLSKKSQQLLIEGDYSGAFENS